MKTSMQEPKNQKLSVGNFGLKFDAKQTLGFKKNLLINTVFSIHITHAYAIYFATLTGLVLDCFVTEMLPIAVSSKEQFVETCAGCSMSRIFRKCLHEPHKLTFLANVNVTYAVAHPSVVCLSVTLRAPYVPAG